VSRAARLLIGAVLAVPSVVVAAPPCLACDCEPTTPAQILDEAEAVFVGEVLGDRLVDAGTAQRFEVERVYAGALPPEIEVYAPIGPGQVDSCGVLYSVGTRVAVAVSYDQEGRLTSTVCAFVALEQVEAVAGAGDPPDPNVVIAPIPAYEPPGPGPGPLPWWAVVGLGASGAVALIWGSIVAGRRRGTRETLAPLPADEDVPPPGDPPSEDPSD
jgi:hypothetical protein